MSVAIDLAEPFEHLPKAPIVEAVIQCRARAENTLDPGSLLETLKQRLPDYPNSQRQQEIGVTIGLDDSSAREHHSWHGYRFESADQCYVAQFTRDGFTFSRLTPYLDWETFESESKRLWNIYRELAGPSEVQRLGVRFINVITPIEPKDTTELLTVPPRGPENFPFSLERFVYRTTFEVPGHPYNLNVTQTIQPPAPPEREAFGLILDLDVFTTRPIPLDEIGNRLPQMRWVKNKAFFSFLSETAINRFRNSSE